MLVGYDTLVFQVRVLERGCQMKLLPESHGGRRTLALGLLAVLIFVANRLSAPGWVFVVLLVALVALVIWTLGRARREG
jgi:hypothetical protein